ncbi:class I SAM-dependent methyltransferase [Paenibacillus validus]|uniref:class I SAM-dependent methyltransferase n=1 Tax=Paenibacillus TaxID=44249 RepID=UPI000FDB5E5F|nr:class I SAM-dependent methyltransferase [Paenibacillus validus]MED4599691.1 class I SAM-dependent methyltransferase [Paenibacillus validus]MED4604876.1 class I SAM-dependent methyltransferase [Paenibacillus validus]
MDKLFNKYYDRLMQPLETKIFGRIRKQLLSKAKGKVLEIGSGTGINFLYYEFADQVIAIEPDPMMLEQSLIKAREATVPIEVVPGDAQNLPYPTNSFDSIVGTLVLCTIPDPAKALAEIHRVCKPEGTILIFEHVRLNHLVLGKIQDWLTPVWKRLCVGCHLNRNTLETVEQAGFRVVQTTSMCRELFLVIEARIK